MRIAYFDCFSGLSGDMTLGALVAAGWPAERLTALPERLRLAGARVTVGGVRRGALAATKVDVTAEGRQPHRHLHHIESILAAADLDPGVRDRSRAVFARLAAAEAEVHGTTIEKVHFHEVGAVDALIDVVGAVQGLHDLGVSEVYASTLPLGGGTVECEHGRIPVPAPATALLLRGAPVRPGPVDFELVTPTGAALITTLVTRWGDPPAYRLERVGLGAGGRDLEAQPNVLRILVGEREGAAARRRVAVLETAVDDDNPQFVGALIPRLLAAGALDAMLVPTVMKKGRPGMWLVVIAEPEAADALAAIMLEETSSLGVRVRIDERIELPRRMAEVETAFGPVAIKVASLPEGGERAVPEFESVRQAAERHGRPLREVSEAAVAAWNRRPGA
ncbi:MAG TPA: nickel pincer cofactor biosynthesis protein LarC [Candidatus Saccharimonadaceae bacterium]|nr:nickel pincer cofactor biosynthesis protein LarC [Candidatus Saccharimonadaceae bacterium]